MMSLTLLTTARTGLVQFLIKVTRMNSWSLLQPDASPLVQNTQIRTRYDHMMWRDLKRRKLSAEYFPIRMRLNAIRKNTILPKELQEIADKEIAALPRESCPTRIHNRCVITSRPRAVKRPWRLARMVFRHHADYNFLSGVTRSSW
ncbi:hypothetical protein CHS0354_014005 [Potamilus streckersoni]|uniref:28S ribosomal protein S14, mitochondrial n=1 Tax=Potamilus streckersoni TaxID=2493646 RepID=A0AAE0TL27_9BIVA|nr:hypothetical protein CHS0354_014005 [Potamilus streckersoni]